ncbi:MAG: cytochrome b/b6 domain-containing protein [Bacteroidales bacterium]|nr:cytochrome b/b6 domain-containing protein [Bacteroidales bacterium]
MKKKTYIYRGYERFWHWSQALLIFFLALTGLEIHGTYKIFGFENVVAWHNIAAWAFLVLIVFTIFWHFGTGEWKQYIPTTKFLKAQFSYYISGIFKGAPHPTHKTIYNKFNPLQRFIYLGLKLLVIPVMVVTGFIYMFYSYPNNPIQLGGLTNIAYIHTLGAFFLLAFVIAHVYLTTTGDKPFISIKAMLTGWEVIDIDEQEERLKHLSDAVNDSSAGYYRIDKEGKIVDVNRAWLSIYKCKDSNKVLGKHFSDTREKKNQQELEKMVDRVLRGEYITGIPVTRKCMDDSIGHHILSMNPVIEENKISGVEGFILDIDETVPLSDYVGHAIRDSSAGYYQLDRQGIIIDVNEAWLKLYKYKNKDEIIGNHYLVTRQPADVNKLNETFSKVMAGDTVSSSLVNRLCKDGSEGRHILSANPVYHGNRIVGMEGFILDITKLDPKT